MSNLAGNTISHYRIIEQVGQGGMGDVYKAEDIKLNNMVALKFLPPELSRDEEAKRRFLNEARAARKFEHPNICTIYDIDETGEGQVFISMPFYEGGTLEEKIKQGPLSANEAVKITSDVAEALNKAHKEGIVHRDIKPSNIMFTRDGTVKVMDFGLAKVVGAKVTKTGTTLGTLAYMSPEQLRGEQVDHRADIWSLGVVLFEMLTGEHPFRAENEQAMFFKILNEPIKKIDLDSLQSPLAEIILKALSKETEGRYQTVSEVLTDLQPFKSDAGSPTAKYKSDNRGKRNKKGRRYFVCVVILILLGLAIVYICYIYCPGKTQINSIAVLPLKYQPVLRY